MTPKERLLKRLPKKYHERVKDFKEEDGLVDDCKYMLDWFEPWTDSDKWGVGFCFPVKSISEAIEHIKNLYRYE